MTEVAAPAAPAKAAPPAAPVSTRDRIKSVLSGQSAPTAPTNPTEGAAEQPDHSKATSVAPAQEAAREPKPAAPNEQVEGDDAPDLTADPQADDVDVPDVPGEDDAPIDPAKLRTLNELSDALGLESDRLMDLELPVKIDGKSGTARLRDLVKSYQLDGHINQKLATFDNDRKSFEAKKVEHERAASERLLRLDAGVKTLERALMGEYQAVDWQKLQAEDPVRFNAEYVSYQQRYAILQDIAKQIASEQQQAQAKAQADLKVKFDEEFKLLQAKVPEWSDAAKRSKEKAETVDTLTKAYGISQAEYESIVDHRQLLVVRDAVRWRKLQESKPAALNKVRAAPKLLKPGTTQSRGAKAQVAEQAARDRLKQSGKVGDAAALLRQRFNARPRAS